jgi:hypothetical protein
MIWFLKSPIDQNLVMIILNSNIILKATSYLGGHYGTLGGLIILRVQKYHLNLIFDFFKPRLFFSFFFILCFIFFVFVVVFFCVYDFFWSN